MSAEHVLTMLNEHEVKFVDLRFTDTKGKEQHVTIPAHQVGNPSDFGNLRRRILLHALGKCLETIRPVLNELMIVQIFFDHDIHHTEGESGVGARANLQPQVGTARNPG